MATKTVVITTTLHVEIDPELFTDDDSKQLDDAAILNTIAEDFDADFEEFYGNYNITVDHRTEPKWG